MTDNFKICIDPDTHNTVPRRIVEVTDEDESLFPEFIEIHFTADAGRPR